MSSSGRCHGPGCNREARAGDWCGESCAAAWERQFWSPEHASPESGTAWSSRRADMLARASCECSVHPVTEHTARSAPSRISLLEDSADQTPPARLQLFREAIRNLGASLGSAGAAIGALGLSQSVTHAAEVERLTLHLRMACPPDRFDEALAMVEDLMDRTWMPRHEALQRVLAEGRFVSTSAEFPQVASNPDPTRGWLARVFDRLFGRMT